MRTDPYNRFVGRLKAGFFARLTST